MGVIKSSKWINKSDNVSIHPECCACPGEKNGMYGRKHTQESKERMSKSKKGKPLSEETKKKLSIKNSGSGNPNYGKHRSHTDETKKKISATSKKLWESESHRQKMAFDRSGDKNTFFGKIHSDESKRKMSESHKRRWEMKRIMNEL